MTGADQGKLSFGDKLAYLIETVHPPDRGLYSYREIAAGIAAHPRAMTAAHINQLVRGFAGAPHPLPPGSPRVSILYSSVHGAWYRCQQSSHSLLSFVYD